MFLTIIERLSFQQDDGDRAYIAVHNKNMKVMNLSSRVVNGLKVFNGDSFRHVASIDRKFVKALLVCCIGVKEINQDILDPIAVSFIRGNGFDHNVKFKI